MSDLSPVAAATAHHPHARAVLSSALAPEGKPSHAYLFHGPPGTGKRAAARAFAAELLADGDPDPDGVRHRVEVGAHPDLTWVKPSGAHVMRVSDIDEPVVAAATRTPFESRRRVFVLEQVETMNDEVANRLLKTLEEPAAFVHLVLLTDAPGRLLETVLSRCQAVRFDPLPPEEITRALVADGVPEGRAEACARLSLGNAERARLLASPEGERLRDEAFGLVAASLAGSERDASGPEPWRGLLGRAEERRKAAEATAGEELARRLELEPKGRERRAIEREGEENAKREGRRARTAVLDLGLALCVLHLRDLACIAEGADDAVLAVDRRDELVSQAEARDPMGLRKALEACEEARLALQVNVNEELALEALGLRMRRLVRRRGALAG